MRKRTTGFVGCLLILIFLLLGIMIIWIGIPNLAEGLFGNASPALTRVQRFSYAFQVLTQYKELTEPIRSGVAKSVEFEILQGDSVTKVAQELEYADLIQNARAFRAYLIYKGLDSQVKSGIFALNSKMSAIEITEAIQSTYSAVVPFYIYAGWRVEEIAAALPSSGIEASPEEFMRLVKNPGEINQLPEFSGVPSYEGFLFPGQYEISRKASAVELIEIFTTRFFQTVEPALIEKIKLKGLSLYEGVTLASIIQRETFKDEERGLIASVFYNRIERGMKLETDPSVQYAIGYTDQGGGWWKTPLFLDDLKVNSPYNTYLINGLPPGPISNPDLSSLKAVADPESTPYFFFRARCDESGLHVFSITFEEHNSKACP